MKIKWFILPSLLVISGVVVLTTFAGHGSRSYSAGSVILTGSSVVRGGGDIRIDDQILPLPGDPGIRGIAFCGNPGRKRGIPSGINPIVPAFSGSSFVEGDQIDDNGHFDFTVVSNANVFGLDPAEICPNPNWVVVAFVPFEFESVVTETSIRNGQESPLGFARDRCTLTGDPTTLRLGEKRPYDCIVLEETHH
jgi:hypothetical protein